MARKHVFGLTDWGRWFMEAMEALADTGRLDRGRNYAGRGRVDRLVISGSRVSARVEGNYRPYYKVAVEFQALSPEEQEALFRLIESDPMLYGRIVAGELPKELIEALEKKKIRLLPRKWADMRRSCDCPDGGDPCKHMAAVYYILAQEIDRDPSALFKLRGVDLAARFGSEKGAEIAQPSVNPGVAIPLPIRVNWVESWTEAGPAEKDLPPLSSYASAIPAFLAPLVPLAKIDLRSTLTEFYHESSRRWPQSFDAPIAEGATAREIAGAEYRLRIEGSSCTIRKGGAAPSTPSALALSPLEAVRLALSVEGRSASPSFRFLKAYAELVRSIVAASAFHPDVLVAGDRFRCVWKPARFGSDVRPALDRLGEVAVQPDIDAAARAALGGAATKKVSIPDRASTIDILVTAALSEYVVGLGFAPSAPALATSPVFRALFRPGFVDASSPSERSLPAALDGRFAVFDLAATGRRFELVVAADRKTSGGTELPRRYSLKATVRGEDGASISLKKAAVKLGPDALAFPAMLSSLVPGLAALGTAASVPLTDEELGRLVVDGAPLLSRLGVSVTLPKELAKLAVARPVLTAKRRAGGGNLESYMDTASAFAFEWKIAIGGETIDVREFQELVKKGERLIRFKDGFIRLDADEAAALLDKIAKDRKPDAFTALQAALVGEASFEGELAAALEGLLASRASSVSVDRAAGDRATRTARERAEAAGRPVPADLAATLRPYQTRGFRWIMANLEGGFGCILADDMGLGKTVQAIAALLALKSGGRLGHGALVCAPAALVTNWERELAKFAPTLSTTSYYGAGRRRKQADVLLTSYETFLRDEKKFTDVEWDIAILDEAHLIKNPEAKKTRAAKAVKAGLRLALSGTPVENNLAEFWSIFDFVLPGYLGSLADFAAKYRRPIEVERNVASADRLRKVTGPFLLRRLKTDRSIIADLPDKVTVDEYASLTAEQAALYEAVAKDGLAKVESSEGIARRGLVLALITALKQISNHPRNWDKESAADVARSGKARLLQAILDAALEAGEKVIVFSQYVEMLDILASVVERELGVVPLRLHGGMTKARRDAAVDRFQTEEGGGVFLVSLKAGGVGLNLTKASRVVHYDLWFNPAVENQATDRAFRIGQTKNVFVHRLITRDTLEERIDEALKSKRELAELAVGTGETWITELGNKELRELVSLR